MSLNWHRLFTKVTRASSPIKYHGMEEGGGERDLSSRKYGTDGPFFEEPYQTKFAYTRTWRIFLTTKATTVCINHLSGQLCGFLSNSPFLFQLPANLSFPLIFIISIEAISCNKLAIDYKARGIVNYGSIYI